MDSPLPSLVAALVGFALGWTSASFQHLLYREPQFRHQPLAGRRAWIARAGLGAATAAGFALAFRPGHYGTLGATLSAVAVAVLATLASTDFERRRIPDRLLLPSVLAAVAAAPLWPDRDLVAALLGGGVGGATGAVLVLFGALLGGTTGRKATAFGAGDAKLMLLIGLLVGWPRVVGALLLGVILGGLPAVALLFTRGRGSTYSYGPYLALAGAILLLWPGLY